MKDPIERREALDEWKNDFKGYINALNMPRDDYNGIIEYINELPSPYNGSYAKVIDKLLAVASAQPETHEKRTETNACDLISKASVCEILADIYPTDGEKVVAVKEVDKAYEAIQQLPSAQPDYTAIKYEIQRNIDDFHNSEHHAQHVLSNGRMIAFGLELALDIIKDAERRKDGQK